jgi:amino acid adenylation domain-containing protein
MDRPADSPDDQLLDRLFDDDGSLESEREPAIAPTALMDAPLSCAQEAMWFLSRLAPESPFYNVAIALRLCGSIDHRVLARALLALVERHEPLRTYFVDEAGALRQVVARPDVELPLIDLRDIPAEEREAAVRRFATEERMRPFDLARAPLFRARLLRLDQTLHVLVLTIHHIVCDAWSSGTLLRELGVLYDALIDGRPSPLAPLPVRYVDYSRWQREWLQGNTLARLVGYWRRQLEGAEVHLALPADHPRPAIERHAGGQESAVLPPPLADAIKAMARAERATMFMALLAAFTVVLHRYTGQHDIVVGCPVAGRDRPELEPLVGLFVNTLVLRADLSGDPTFREALQRVRDVCLDAYAHQDLPFERLVQELHPRRDLSRNPFFQVMFVFQNGPDPAAVSEHFTVTPMLVENPTEKFDLTLEVEQRGSEVTLHLSYNRDLFEPATARRMLDHFRAAVEVIAEHPNVPIGRLSLLTADERQRLLVTFNDTASPMPRACLHELITEQARRTPDAVAVVFGDRTMTYGELDRRAGQLAGRLRRLAVAPESVVAVFLERSPEMVIALLGVLKAGGAYLPLDPSYPNDRLRYMLEDARARVVITQTARIDALPSLATHIIALDRDGDDDAAALDADVRGDASPANLAYVMYTSGSTGRPKGVAVPHSALVNYLTWAASAYAVAEGTGAVVHSSLAFDLTITGLFTPLLCGRTVFLVDERGIDALGLAASQLEGLSLIKITPAHLEVLAHVIPPDRAARLARMFVIGGEALFAEHLTYWRTHAAATRLVNEYGPTETVVGCCVFEAPAGELADRAIPIGRPIANTRLYVLDRNLEPLPAGAVGELYIGGAGVARGYLGAPDLTAASFVPDPFGCEAGARQYRTGDLARHGADGELEFLGRIDQQVKLRGFRVELQEIERVLADHPAVDEAVVLLHEDRSGDKRLAAYVVRAPGRTDAPDDLHRHLESRLPKYMVPHAIVVLDRMPLTVNGKVDRDRLPRPAARRGADPNAGAPASNGVEPLLTRIWADVLGVDWLNRDEDFFDLGGHSLLAIHLIARVRDATDLELPLTSVFEFPTVRRFAEHLEAIRGISHAKRVPIDRAATREGIEL